MRHIFTEKQRIEQFWSRVDKTKGLGPKGTCWEWTGTAREHYGRAMYVDKNGVSFFAGAHCVSYRYSFGPVPPGKVVMHKCDNKHCVRPSHLKLGWPYENTQDMICKHRHGRKKLTFEQVKQIRSTYQCRIRFLKTRRERTAAKKEVAARYGVSLSWANHVGAQRYREE